MKVREKGTTVRKKEREKGVRRKLRLRADGAYEIRLP